MRQIPAMKNQDFMCQTLFRREGLQSLSQYRLKKYYLAVLIFQRLNVDSRNNLFKKDINPDFALLEEA